MCELPWKYAAFILLTGAALSQNEDGTTRLVNIPQGTLRGYKDPAEGVYAFYNIPYATAPTGTDKFKAPLEPPVWTDVFDAVDRRIVCPQPGNYGTMQEDCLVANVFVPDTGESDLPILVIVHGGAYQYGIGNSETWNTLVRTNRLIVVTFNYRLGAHGFLCLGTEAVPGNAGLKDQVALLRWVKTNIRSFGGNPDEVTLLGCSAGGGSVDILTLSGITTGLFRRAVIESGAAIGSVGAQREPIANAQNYARILKFNNVDDLNALEEFYKSSSYETLVSQHSVVTNRPNSTVMFAPCVERDLGQERILDDAPINIVKQGKYNKIPLLYGYANMEGLMRIRHFQLWKDMMNENFVDFLPGELRFETIEDKQRVANMVKAYYFGNQPVNEENVLTYIDYFTDVLFAYPMLKLLAERIKSLNDQIYLYEYSFVDENSPSIPHTDIKGANHCDQTYALADEDMSSITEEYKTMKDIIQEYWLSFIWHGSPSVDGSQLVQWPPVNQNRTPHMSLGSTIELKNILIKGRAEFWDSIYDEYYQGPLPPTGSAESKLFKNLNVTILTISVIFYYFV